MATAAAAVAKDQGLEVVTDAPHVHGVAACRDEETIYQTLVRGAVADAKARKRPNGGKPTTLRLAHLVFVNRFDLSELTADRLAAMSRESEALFDFRRMLAERVVRIPRMDSEARREKYLKGLAEEVVAEWERRRRTWSRFAKRFFGAGLLDQAKDTTRDLVKSLIPAALTSTAGTGVAAAPGLAIGLAFYTAKTWHALGEEQQTGPLRYLSLLERQGAALMAAAPPLAEE